MEVIPTMIFAPVHLVIGVGFFVDKIGTQENNDNETYNWENVGFHILPLK